jgi:hypothetical protein
MANEPGAAVMAIFDNLIDMVKQTRPIKSDGTSKNIPYVYSPLILGEPVDPEDYCNPWTPTASTVAASTQAPAAGAAASNGAAAPAPGSLTAAYKTAMLCNRMLAVTPNQYTEYPDGRQLNVAYQTIIAGAQPGPLPPISPDVQASIDSANATLYTTDEFGDIMPTPVYAAYRRNAKAYAVAKATYAGAYAAAMSTPATQQVWPVQSATYQQTVDDAYNQLMTQGANKVELALSVLESVGIPIQDKLIAQAKKTYDAYNLGLAGSIPTTLPYSYINPSGWADPNNNDEGWQHLTVTQSSYQAYTQSGATTRNQGSWNTSSSSTSGGGAVSFGFVTVGAEGGTSNSSESSQASDQGSSQSGFSNSATGLTIDIDYMLIDIVRPWLFADLFYMKGWYCVNYEKNGISTGTAGDQLGITDPHLLPMIPQQALVIRNVTITATSWGSDGQVLSSYYDASQQSASSSSSNVTAGAMVSLGFVNFGGSVSHSQSQAGGQSGSWSAKNSSGYFKTTFDGTTLNIPGAQIVCFVSDIVPASAPLADPELGKTVASTAATAPAATASTPTPAVAPAAVSTPAPASTTSPTPVPLAATPAQPSSSPAMH